MNLDFFLKEEPLDKLVSSYLEIDMKFSGCSANERSKKQIVLLNSILVDVNSQKQGLKTLLTEVKYCLEVNEKDRKCQENAAKLLKEVIKRSRQVLVKAKREVTNELVAFSCQKVFIAVCGNAFISLLYQICMNIDLSVQQQVLSQLLALLVNPKLLVSTFRQETRLSLYKLYLLVLHFYEKHGSEKLGDQLFSKNFIEKVIHGGSGEKDPRNISLVFQLYLTLLKLFSEEKIIQYRSIMFQNLESYYPIEFVGDQNNEQHQKINVKQISALLDQCLTHKFFKNEAWELFSTKTAAPPIAPFVSTFLIYLSKRRTDSEYSFLASRLKNLLARLSEEEFLDQDYPLHQPDLGHVYVSIIDFLFCRDDHSFESDAYTIVLNWLEKMIDRVMVGTCKKSGTMMGIFRCIVKNKSVTRFRTFLELFRNYSLRRVLKGLTNDEDIIPKLGLAIVALSQNHFVSCELEEIVSLLILRVGKLYEEVNDEIKMLLLKILLEAYRGFPNNRLMVRTTNDSLILKDCLSRAKWAFSNPLNQTQSLIIKSFIDFISTVYLNKLDSLLSSVEGANYELETYLIARLFEAFNSSKQNKDNEPNKQMIVEKFNLLSQQLSNKEQRDGMVTALKAIDYRSCFYLISEAKWSNNKDVSKLLISMFIELGYHFSKSRESENLENQPENKNTNMILSYLLKSSPKSMNENTLLQELWIQFSGQTQIMFPSFSQFHQLNLQSFRYQAAFSKGYKPTLVHFLWQHLKSIQSQQIRQKQAVTLLEHLPEKILLRDSQQILRILLKSDKQGASLWKIVNHLQFDSLEKAGIVQHCLEYIQALYEEKGVIQKDTQKNVCILAVIISLLEKDKGGKLKMTLIGMKKQWKKLLMNRKRPIRQAVRKILLMLQE